ncbi:hypothetical protein [Marinobacter caseinilyticus]|uniref:hypothetical protein n=1 Tax=Marinobacter caseinilyticus TaxID=2692195 RepID=UPI001409E968|nr:hypothetical protein [Marinobacter caseinilyticus]
MKSSKGLCGGAPPLSVVRAGVWVSLISLISFMPSNGTAQEESLVNGGGVSECFPTSQIKDISNFRQYSNELFLMVARKMGITIDRTVPMPAILTDLELTEEEFNLWLRQTAGPFHAMFPYYFPDQNTILVLESSRLDSLVHEFVHFFQVKYRHVIPDLLNGVQLEYEATEIQHWFRAHCKH